ncbi:MAG: hypothetical protein CVU05_09915 [Bacteroidetes bacterium HGW-Bacteroidetes-21]|jgi:ferredoxin|nr:MAG: hypothetical protein CVU05_09915 [Bacteroidetes bacterium HGW-Bacteroidetes-21]
MTGYSQVNILFFSGTGNAFSAASWFKEKALEYSRKVTLQSIENKITDFELPTQERTLFVFTYPTHGFAPPWIMLKFMLRFCFKGPADVAFINTQAGSKLWKFYFPGMSGIALWLPMLIFRLKGFRLKGALPLDMPHSWISFFPPNPKSDNLKIADRCKRIVEKMSDKILSGKKYFRYTLWLHLWFDIPVAIIAPAYLFIGRFFLAKTLYPSYACNSCRICEKSCPVHAIVIQNDRPYWKYNCESCMRCMNICPQKSIQSWVTRIGIIIYFLTLIFVSFVKIDIWLASQIVLVLIFPLYWIFIHVLRVKFVNYLFTYTSLTRYWGRYFARGVKIKDLQSRELNNIP